MWTEKDLDQLEQKDGFRQRGLQTTRLETFIDAAFAFAVTMLVISVGDIPNNYSDLIEALKGTPAFGMSFATVLLFWLGHRRFSRRYGLEDGTSLLISMGLIFLILVYVYPLKLMFSALSAWISRGWLPSEFRINDLHELINLFVIYGFGFALLTALMTLLHQRAKYLRDKLLLNRVEILTTNQEIALWSILMATGLVSGLFALIFPPRIAIYAGFVYFNLPVSMNVTAIYYARKIKKALIESDAS